MHRHRVVALDEDHLVTVPLEQLLKLIMLEAGQQGWIGDFVAVEVQNRQYRAVGDGVDELIRVPTGGECASLGFAVTDHAGDQQVWIVKRRTVGVQQRVAQLAALVDAARRFRRDVAGDAAGKRELLEQTLQPGSVLRNTRVNLAVRPLEIRVGDDAGPAVTGPGDVNRAQVVRDNQSVHMRVDKIQSRCRAPVPEQARFDVF